MVPPRPAHNDISLQRNRLFRLLANFDFDNPNFGPDLNRTPNPFSTSAMLADTFIFI